MIAAAFASQSGPRTPNDSQFTQYVNCTPVEQAPAAQRTFSSSFPELCLRRRIITALSLLGLIIRTEAPCPGHVDHLLSYHRVTHCPSGLSSPDATQICAQTQLVRHTEHAGSAVNAGEPLPDGTFSGHMDLNCDLKGSMIARSFLILHLFS